MAHLSYHSHHSHDTPTTDSPGVPILTRLRKLSAPDTMPSSRNNSTSSTASSPLDPTSPRHASQPPIRSRSVAYGTAVILERDPAPPSDDDIMFVTVRLTNPFLQGSKHGAEDLPNRPPRRSFLRRLGTRFNMDHTAEREQRYKAVKMPRGEYKRFFRHDVDGNYAGTEPEREWDEEELTERFREYQDAPLSRNFV